MNGRRKLHGCKQAKEEWRCRNTFGTSNAIKLVFIFHGPFQTISLAITISL